MPSAWVIGALQVIGAIAAVAGRRPAPARTSRSPLAWASLLVLAGLKDSLGKILHNDVLLLLAAVPFLMAAGEARSGDRRTAAPGTAGRSEPRWS